MNQPNHSLSGRLLGVVQLRVGGQVYAVPVSALDFAGGGHGGFFAQDGEMGILVDQAASEEQMRSQVMEGCAQAVRHLSAKFLN